MYLAINLLGLVVFLAIGWVFSADRKNIDYKSVGCMLVLNLAITWLLTSFEAGRTAVKAAADGFAAVVKLSYKGINFALENWVGPDGIDPTPANFVVSALLPILLILPLFDILTYIGFLPWLIKWIGRGLSFVTRRPKFETFYALEMMFLGNADAIAASRVQLQRMKASRNVVISMMSMSCVSAAIIGSYVQMMPGEFVITAIPLNCINALTVSHMLFPVVISKEEDVIYSLYDEIDTSAFTAEELAAHEATVAQYQALPRWRQLFKHDPSKPAKEPFFSFLGDSIMNGGKVILIVTANVITFVALAGMIDSGLALIWDKLSLESILGVIMYVPSLLLGLNRVGFVSAHGSETCDQRVRGYGTGRRYFRGSHPFPRGGDGIPHLVRELLDPRPDYRHVQEHRRRGIERCDFQAGGTRVALRHPRFPAVRRHGRPVHLVAQD